MSGCRHFENGQIKNTITNHYLKIPPAMQAGLIKRLMTIEDIANLLEEAVPKKRGSYKKKDNHN